MVSATSEYETVDTPSKNHHTAPVKPTGPQLTRREVWVDIDEELYPGFKAKLWVNYPRSLINDLNQTEDPERRLAALCKMVTAHNGWVGYDGNEFAPADEPGFWNAIPDELAAALIALVNREAGKLARSVSLRPNR